MFLVAVILMFVGIAHSSRPSYRAFRLRLLIRLVDANAGG